MPTRARPTEIGPSLESDTGSGRLPLVVYVLALGTFLMLTTEFIVAGILPDVASDLGVSLPVASSLITVFAIGMVVGAPTMTLLTLRLSRKRTLLAALSVFFVGHIIVAVSSEMDILMVARFLTALATGAFWAVSAVVAGDAAGSSLRSRAIGVVGAGGSLATVLGVPLGAFLAHQVGWRGTFWALAAASAVAALLVARFVPAPHAQAGRLNVRDALSALRSGRLWAVLLACLTTCGGVLAVYSFLVPLLTDVAGIPGMFAPLVLTGFGVGSFLGTLVAGRLGDRRPHAVTIAVPTVTTLVLLAMTLTAGAPVITVILVVLLGLFGLSSNTVLIHLAVGYAGRAATLGSGLTVAAFNAGTALGTALAGAAIGGGLGLTASTVVGTSIVVLTLIPTIGLALTSRARTAAPRPTP
ncbi:MFS transporter [Zhihengliuella sp. ISTPL4]|uniref:MFS transporter n=1 Tax=Zhihengliuella sp. ISTPL4 TaxID=2058657 RepID=UPI000C7DB11F|nr:MFS transporter [Zhihengliuella sp. ISTPL4]